MLLLYGLELYILLIFFIQMHLNIGNLNLIDFINLFLFQGYG